MDAALKFAGLPGDEEARVAALRRVQLNDAHPFGEKAAGAVNLIELNQVEISTTDKSLRGRVDLLIFLDDDQRLICAATSPRPAGWVSRCPSLPRMDPEVEARRVHIQYHHQHPSALRMSLRDVLAAIWSQRGVSPSDAGQVILRPRHVVPHFPMVQHGDGEDWRPEHPEGPHWIVEVRGALIRPVYSPQGQRVGHLSSLLGLVADENGRMFYAIGMS